MNTYSYMLPVYISSDTLRSFARMDITWKDICPASCETVDPQNVICNAYHKLTPDDIRSVALRCLEMEISVSDFMFEWWEPLHIFLRDCAGITDLFREITGDPNGIYAMKELPQDDDEITLWALMEFGRLSGVFDVPYKPERPLTDLVRLEDIVKMTDWHEEDVGMSPVMRRYPDAVKEAFIAEYDNDLILQDSDDEIRALFRAFTDDLADKENLLALKIKGYACYGGNSIYQCDFEAAAECLEILWRKGSVGYAANTLGYMHYHGELSKGIPDYRTAFFYYSAASQFGVTESKLMLSRMLFDVTYVAKNPLMSYTMLEQLYYHEKERFEDEDPESRLAEVAYEMAEAERLDRNPYIRDFMGYKNRRYLIQARFAYSRNAVSPVLRRKIDRALSSGQYKYKEYKKTYSCPVPEPLMEFVNDSGYSNYLFRCRVLKSGKLKITVQRLASPERDPDKSLLTHVNFGCCELTDSISFTASKPEAFELPGRDADKFVFDGVELKEGTLLFFFNGRPVAKLKAEKYTIARPE